MPMVRADSYSIGQAVSAPYLNAGSAAATTKTLDLSQASTQELTLAIASGLTVTLKNGTPDPGTVKQIRLILTQDATGSRLLPTFSPALNYGVAGAPTLSTVAGKKDLFVILIQGANYYVQSVTKGF